MRPHNGERSRTVATSAIRTLVVLAGGLRCPVGVGLRLHGARPGHARLTVVGLSERGTNPRFQLGRQRPAPAQDLAEMGGVQSHPWGKFVDDQLAPSDLGTQVAGRVIGRSRLGSHSGPSWHQVARDAHDLMQILGPGKARIS